MYLVLTICDESKMSCSVTKFQSPKSSSCRSIAEVRLDESPDIDNIRTTIDNLDIKKVPSEFESVSQPSRVVEELLEKKQKLRGETLTEMGKKLCDIQEKCANDIKNCSESMKMKIADIRRKIQEIQEEFENDLARYSDEGRKTVREILMTQLDREANLIDEFLLELRDIERQRVQRVKEAVINYQELLRKIGCISLENSVIMTCDEIREFNRIILRNYKAYEKLMFNLNVRTDNLREEIDIWLDKIRIWHPKSKKSPRVVRHQK